MGKFKPFVFGTLLGVGVTFVALQFHVVQSAEGFRLVPRTPQPSIGLAYADIRHWSAEQWADRPELARALVAHGSTDLVASSVSDGLIESISSEGSALDKLRGLMNDESDKAHVDSLFDEPGQLTVPQDSNTSVEDTPAFDDIFSIPFPQDARKTKLAPKVTQRQNPDPMPLTAVDDFRSQPDTAVARRDLPSIEGVLGGENRDPFRPATSTPPRTSEFPASPPPTFRESSADPPNDRPGGRANSFSPEEETQALEDLLFGPEPADTSTQSSVSAQNDFQQPGMFDDITSSVRERSHDVLNKARTGLQNETSTAVEDATGAVGRYVRERVQQSVPESFSSMFEAGSTAPTTLPFESDDRLPAALQAIQDGFDPFVD